MAVTCLHNGSVYEPLTVVQWSKSTQIEARQQPPLNCINVFINCLYTMINSLNTMINSLNTMINCINWVRSRYPMSLRTC